MKNIINEKPNKKLLGRIRKTISFVDKKDLINKAIVNVGCGYGWFELHALKRSPKKIVGIEITEADLSTIRKHVKHEKFSTKVGSAIQQPFKDKTQDTIVAWEVIEHIPKNTENIFFKEANRVLKKNGIFYLSTPYLSFLSTFFDPAYWLNGHRHYSKKQFENYATKNNFTIEKWEVTGGAWTVFSLLNTYVSKWIFRRKPFFKEFFLSKEDKEYMQVGFHNIFIKLRKI